MPAGILECGDCGGGINLRGKVRTEISVPPTLVVVMVANVTAMELATEVSPTNTLRVPLSRWRPN